MTGRGWPGRTTGERPPRCARSGARTARRRYPRGQAAEAIRYVETERAPAKVLLTVA